MTIAILVTLAVVVMKMAAVVTMTIIKMTSVVIKCICSFPVRRQPAYVDIAHRSLTADPS